MKSVSRYRKLFFSLILMLSIYSSCSVQYVAEYDASIKQEIVRIAKLVDLFWGELLDTPIEDRKYDNFKKMYNKIETDLRGLKMMNEIRPLNKASTKQSENALILWIEDKKIHKENDGFSNFEAKSHRKQYMRVFIAMAKGEEAKDI